jgi:hypothetical protein
MAMKFQNLLSPAALQQIYSMLNQMRATGRVVTPKDVEAAYRAVLQTEAEKSLQNRQMEYNRRLQQQQFRMQKQLYEDKKDSDKMAGLGMGASLLFQGLKPTMSVDASGNLVSQSPLGSLFGWLKKPAAGIQDQISNIFSPAVGAGTSAVAPAIDSALNLAAPAAALGTDIASQAVPDFADFAMSAIAPAAGPLGDLVSGSASNILDDAVDIGADFMDDILEGIDSLF